MNLVLDKDYVFKRKKIGRVGIIDVGSNSVRLVVFAGFSRSPTYFFNEKVLCGLGKGLSYDNKLNVVGKEKAISSDEIKWITYDDIDQYPFPKANVKVLEALKQVQLSII